MERNDNILAQTLARFDNGQERYEKSATFNQVIRMIVMDVDHCEIMNALLAELEASQESFKKHMIHCPGPQYVIKDPDTTLIDAINVIKNKQREELILKLIEIEIGGSLVASLTSWGWAQELIAKYIIWKVTRKVDRWLRMEKYKLTVRGDLAEAIRQHPLCKKGDPKS